MKRTMRATASIPGTFAQGFHQRNLEKVISLDWWKNRQHTSAIPERFIPSVWLIYFRSHEAEGRAAANIVLKQINNSLKFGAISLADSDDDLCDYHLL